mmetsp:Transcript_5242/g.8019  ORF Transcript_5242/g.8019 Transcript_5242/m.8019 type:complete len:209 (+) Transcript_5242:409-1035(+)
MDAYNLINCLVDCINGSSPRRSNVSLYPIRSCHLHSRSRNPTHTSRNLQPSHPPKLIGQTRLISHQSFQILIFQPPLFLLRNLLEPRKDSIQLIRLQDIPQLLQTCSNGIAPTMFSKNDTSSRFRISTHESNGFRSHNFVSLLVFDHTILMDSRFVLECVCTYDCLVGLAEHSSVFGYHFGSGRNVHRVDSSKQPSSTRTTLELIITL